MRISDWSSDVCSSDLDTKQIHILGRKSCAQGCDERVLLVDCETDAAVIGVALPERGLTLLKELLPTPPMPRYAAGSDPVDDLTQPLPHPMRRAGTGFLDVDGPGFAQAVGKVDLYPRKLGGLALRPESRSEDRRVGKERVRTCRS